jgi:hypothetical protein
VTETNVFPLSQPGTFADPLTEVLRNGARALLTQAVEAEVAALISCHASELTDDGRQRLVRPTKLRCCAAGTRAHHPAYACDGLPERRLSGRRSMSPIDIIPSSRTWSRT